MILRVYDRSTAARILHRWRDLGFQVRLLTRGVAWCSRCWCDTHVLTLAKGVRHD